MEYVKKTYVEFLLDGGEETLYKTEEVGNRDIEHLIIPDDAYAFMFFDKIFATVEDNGNKVELKSGRLNVSPRYHYGVRLEGQETIVDVSPQILFALMSDLTGEKVTTAVRSLTGGLRPLLEGEIFIEAKNK